MPKHKPEHSSSWSAVPKNKFVQWGPFFRLLNRESRLASPVWKAASLKLALNQLIAAEISAFALSLGLVQRAGVPVDTVMAILRESALFAQAFEKKVPQLLTRNYQHPNFSARHLSKDVELFLREASGYELTASSLEGIRPVLERTIARGLATPIIRPSSRSSTRFHSFTPPATSLLPAPASDRLAKGRAPF